MQDVFDARAGHFAEMFAMGLIIEHGSTGERTRPNFLIEVDVILIAGKRIDALFLFSVLFQSKGERSEPNFAFFDIIFI